MLPVGIHFAVGNLKCFCQPDNTVHVFGTAPHVTLLRAPVHEWVNLYPLGIDIEKANAFGAVEFVTGANDKVDGKLLQIMSKMAHGLHRVGVKNGVVRPADLPCPIQIQQVPDFIVPVHERHQRTPLVRPQQLVKVRQIDMAFLINIDQT